MGKPLYLCLFCLVHHCTFHPHAQSGQPTRRSPLSLPLQCLVLFFIEMCLQLGKQVAMVKTTILLCTLSFRVCHPFFFCPSILPATAAMMPPGVESYTTTSRTKTLAPSPNNNNKNSNSGSSMMHLPKKESQSESSFVLFCLYLGFIVLRSPKASKPFMCVPASCGASLRCGESLRCVKS